MPIVLPAGLPAAATLRAEGSPVLDPAAPARLRIGLLNLMPDKVRTETQFARLLAEAAEPVALVPVRLVTHRAKSAPPGHMERFYVTWDEARQGGLDGLIVTGAPVELLPFEAVDYWAELGAIMEAARAEIAASLYVCWAAQAALARFRGVRKRALPQKAFGVFAQTPRAPGSTLLRGLRGGFRTPVSRHTEVVPADVAAQADLEVVAASDETGLSLIDDPENRAAYLFDHLEYDADTLGREHRRDLAAGKAIAPPRNFDPAGQEVQPPWRPDAALLYRNWLDRVAAGRDGAAALDGLVGADAGRSLTLYAESRPDLLASVLRRLDELGVVPDALRIAGRIGQIVVVEIAANLGPGTGERVAQALLAVAGARKVLFRLPDGSGGLFRPVRPAGRPRPDIGPLPFEERAG
ncbi:MAG TPA: homoserine O-succinyltransferase [Beijerinckiaceae bacterium]|nr:homoserine O-succinyltransferase [Beijerinckiaceae bacterium]